MDDLLCRGVFYSNTRTRVLEALLVIGPLWLAACTHTEEFTRDMTWPMEPQVGMRDLPAGAPAPSSKPIQRQATSASDDLAKTIDVLSERVAQLEKEVGDFVNL